MSLGISGTVLNWFCSMNPVKSIRWIRRQDDRNNNIICNHFVFSANKKMYEVYENIIAAVIECNSLTKVWSSRVIIIHGSEINELLFYKNGGCNDEDVMRIRLQRMRIKK